MWLEVPPNEDFESTLKPNVLNLLFMKGRVVEDIYELKDGTFVDLSKIAFIGNLTKQKDSTNESNTLYSYGGATHWYEFPIVFLGIVPFTKQTASKVFIISETVIEPMNKSQESLKSELRWNKEKTLEDLKKERDATFNDYQQRLQKAKDDHEMYRRFLTKVWQLYKMGKGEAPTFDPHT